MTAKYIFTLTSRDKRRDLPRKVIIGRQDTETTAHVVLKLLAFVLFFRERLQREVNLHMDSVPFVPDLVQLDYELRPILWVECGDCGVSKLNKLAVKVPDAEIWIVKRSLADAQHLLAAMSKQELRRDRYNLVAFDHGVVEELCGLVQSRNEVEWICGGFDPPGMQFDFNGLWFDTPFAVMKF